MKVLSVICATLVVGLSAHAEEMEQASWFDLHQGWFDFHAFYTFDVSSAYVCRGKIFEDRPIQVNELAADVGFGPFGRLGFYHWDYSSLSGDFQDKYRRFMPETDWGIYYTYKISFADDWWLNNKVQALWLTYNGGRPKSDPHDYEWRFEQTLGTPYLNPWWRVRRNFEASDFVSFEIGAKRGFEIFERFSVMPNVWATMGDDVFLRTRYGRRPGGGDYSHGLCSVNGELTAEYAFTECASIHLTIGEYLALSQQGRGNLHSPMHRNLTYFTLGFTLQF